ncbi:hypothetical protein EDB86DRAFT_2829221 [Lactarius hatsudake]|nr:hypothetical protein EDB86DRAFT_2829221 [Lactarius hatsudake]
MGLPEVPMKYKYEKQHLISIVWFLSGQIAFGWFIDKDPITQELWWYLVPPAYQGKQKEMSTNDKKLFKNICIASGTTKHVSPSFLITDLTPSEISVTLTLYGA